ncbi:DUF6011 domain-containing protein [Streptomyces cellulosae]|uniref:DUF6011 domain-containing protein n=1 Tax=Streptomyces cellulosae TaxID=1968 RepID=UPI000A92A536|nr:DUF6011 domain-containing protein [Streptomyces cellulosae]
MACGRLLSNEESKRLRLGPQCLKRLQAALAPRPRRIGTYTAAAHPQAVPVRITSQLAFEIWDEDDEPARTRPITDVPTGALL